MNPDGRISYESARPVDISDEPTLRARGDAIDVARLLERCLSDRAFCAGVVRKFAARAPGLGAALDEAAAADNNTELARLAHLIKGLAANLSACNLHVWASALERAARGGDSRHLRPLVDRVQSEVHRCLDFVPRVLTQLAESS